MAYDFVPGGKQGICPYCGSENIEYLAGGIDDAGYSYECECNHCTGKFLECYDLEFAGFTYDDSFVS